MSVVQPIAMYKYLYTALVQPTEDRGAEVLGAGLARAMGSGGAPFLN